MTIGYPDYQTIVNVTGAPIANALAWPLTNINSFSASGNVANYPSSYVKVVSATVNVGGVITVTFYPDATLTSPIGVYRWVNTGGTDLVVIVPNLGPFVKITMTTTAVAVNNTLIQMRPIVAACASPRYCYVANEVNLTNAAIPASGVTVIQLPFVSEGPGSWMVNPRDATGKLNTVVWTLRQDSSTFNVVDSIANPTVSSNRIIYGSAQPLALVITNTDAGAAHSLDARLVIDGR